jgi:hypothetical protein
MLVQINTAYKGVFGYYDRALNTVIPKRAGDPPFEVADDVARRQITAGVLAIAKEEGEPKAEQKEKLTVPEETKAQEPAGHEAGTGGAGKPYEDMSYSELKAEAKKRGIKVFGQSAYTLRRLLEGGTDEEAPVLSAEDPV